MQHPQSALVYGLTLRLVHHPNTPSSSSFHPQTYEKHEPVWSTAFSGNGEAHEKLKGLQQKRSVVVVRNQTKRRLQFFGPPDKYQQVQRDIIELVKEESTKSHYIPLDPDTLSWACQGGFKQITNTLGDDVASLDILSNPKRIIITGSEKQYQTALAVAQGRGRQTQSSATASEDCAVCWTEAENPILTQCTHVYCLECFENLCTSATSTDGTFLTSCQGETGKCAKVSNLRELQYHLSSTAFEDILEASHTSYIRRHPQSLRYCPTPDCGYIYRTTSNVNAHTCPKCFELICTACHAQNSPNMTCADYKDLNSWGYAAFEKYKREQGIKDCPKCSTPIEKTEGSVFQFTWSAWRLGSSLSTLCTNPTDIYGYV